MSAIYVIAVFTVKEIMRSRILHGAAVFATLLMGFSLALGPLSFAEQNRIILNWTLTSLHLVTMGLSLFWGSTLFFSELEKGVLVLTLTRPISRYQYWLGKYLGILAVLVLALFGLSLVPIILTGSLLQQKYFLFYSQISGMILEAMVLLSFAMLVSLIVKPLVAVALGVTYFLTGHWLDRLSYLATTSKDLVLQRSSDLISYFVPNFEIFNWRSRIIYDQVVTRGEMFYAGIYAIGWTVLFLSLSYIVFRRQDIA